MDIVAARRKLDQRRATMDGLRSRPLTAAEKLANLKWVLGHCDKCDGEIAPNAEVCPHCQYRLM